MELVNHYYNGEHENMFRPWVGNPPYQERAIPKEILFFWRTGKAENEQKQANIFLNWDDANEAFKKAGSKIDMQIKVSENNNEIEVFLNGQTLKTDSIRIYNWRDRWSERYKD
ncbi:hypothetical protein [Chryseobacterium indoltheticum]|uniref:hypothetical protein n=1 Tax=Chryseobacterium indoltheticum TaxID=254 RepID=UPI003F4996F5